MRPRVCINLDGTRGTCILSGRRYMAGNCPPESQPSLPVPQLCKRSGAKGNRLSVPHISLSARAPSATKRVFVSLNKHKGKGQFIDHQKGPGVPGAAPESSLPAAMNYLRRPGLLRTHVTCCEGAPGPALAGPPTRGSSSLPFPRRGSVTQLRRPAGMRGPMTHMEGLPPSMRTCPKCTHLAVKRRPLGNKRQFRKQSLDIALGRQLGNKAIL